MSNFKAKLAFFQNASLQQQQVRQQQQIHQTQFNQQPIQQQQKNQLAIHQFHPPQINQQFPPSLQTQKISTDSSSLSYSKKVNSATPGSINTDSQLHPSTVKPSIVVPKTSANMSYKSKLAFFNQQPTPLVPLHPNQNDSNLKKHEQSSLYKENITQPSFVETINTETSVNHSFPSTLNNENIAQPTNTEYKAQLPSQPAKSFKDKLAMLSNIQQPMGVYDYKKKYNTNQSNAIESPTQTFSDAPDQSLTETPLQLKPQPPLPSLQAGRARRPARRPPSLVQTDQQLSSLPPTS